MLAKAVESAVKRISSGITDNVKAHTATTEQRQAINIMDVVKTIQPAIETAIAESLSTVLADIGKIEKLDGLKGMVKGIEIPDYSTRLDNLDAAVAGTVKKIPTVDLKPVMDQLATISGQLLEEDDEPKEWTFQFNRDPQTKLLDSVDVVSK